MKKNKVKWQTIKIFLPTISLCFSGVLLITGMFFEPYLCIIAGTIIFKIALIEPLYVFLTKPSKLHIETPDGTDEPLHPSVCFINEAGLAGYHYWLAFTPFPIHSPIYRDRYECPCVVASQDGINWKYIGEKKYLDDLTETQISTMDYFSDPELVFNHGEGKLFLYYRLSTGETYHNKKVQLFRKYSMNGSEWSDREQIDVSLIEKQNLVVISPTVCIINGVYYMWFVSGKKYERKVYSSWSKDGIRWDNVKQCSLKGIQIDPWHICCKLVSKSYILIIYDMKGDITLWNSKDGVQFSFQKTLIIPNKNYYSFYRSTLYRASFCFDGLEYKMYFTAGNDMKNSIGLMHGKTMDSISICTSKECRFMLNNLFEEWIYKYINPFSILYYKLYNKTLK